jgi:two-component system response regulator VanR
MIPKIDGFGVCEVIRKKSDVPIVFLSALDDEKSLMRGYDISADDYVTKPFSMPVFMRKVRAILKRKRSNDDADRITYGRVVMVPDRMLCTVDGKEIDLTSKEYELLLIMIKRPGYVYTRDMLLDMVWDYNVYVDERIVDSHIKNIRRKIGIDIIETVRGRGYRVASKD